MASANASTLKDLPEKWVMVHDGRRDHYQLPIALAEEGMLERFVTDWYTPMENPLWRGFTKVRALESRLKLAKRYSSLLPSSLTTDSKSAYAFGYVSRMITKAPYRDDLEGERAGSKAAQLANRERVNLLATSYSAASAFAHLDQGLRRVLFQIHPQPRFLRNLYSELIAKDEDYAGLAQEQEMLSSDEQLEQWTKESTLAEHIICASSFTKRTLLESGKREDEISVLPYGVDTSEFPYGVPEPNQPLRVLFVGQKVARKSLQTLLRVWSELKPQNAELIIAGGHNRDEAILSRFAGVFTDVPQVSKSELIRLFQQADLFVLPSVAEGFGHVYLEALSCGTPILCTENTGGADLLEGKDSGWIARAGDPASLAACLTDALSNRQRLHEMRPRARAIAEHHTWTRFRGGLREVLERTGTQQ